MKPGGQLFLAFRAHISLQLINHIRQNTVNLLRGLRRDKDSVILQKHHLHLLAMLLLVHLHSLIAKLSKGVSRTADGNPDHLSAQNLLCQLFGTLGAGKTIDQRRMNVKHIGLGKQAVKQCFHAGTLA